MVTYDKSKQRRMTQTELQQRLNLHSLWLSTDRRRGEPQKFESVDLSGLNLKGADLRDMEFENVTFWEVNMDGVILSNPSKNPLQRAIFHYCDFFHASLEGVSGCEIVFYRCRFHQSTLEKARLIDCEFKNCELDEVSFKDSILPQFDSEGSHFCEVDFEGADLSGFSISQSRFAYINLKNANMRRGHFLWNTYGGITFPEKTFLIMEGDVVIFIANGETLCYEDTLRDETDYHNSLGVPFAISEFRKFTEEQAEGQGGGNIPFFVHVLDILDLLVGKGERPAWTAGIKGVAYQRDEIYGGPLWL